VIPSQARRRGGNYLQTKPLAIEEIHSFVKGGLRPKATVGKPLSRSIMFVERNLRPGLPLLERKNQIAHDAPQNDQDLCFIATL
jgi:hypothetical protein